jgi:hypothetical protein
MRVSAREAQGVTLGARMRREPDAVANIHFGAWRARVGEWSGLGVVIEGLVNEAPGVLAPADYTNEVLLAEPHREGFLELIDRAGLVVCRQVGGDDAAHRDVRGRSSRGKLSQGEYYHHDGCSGPTKPRVVEIRCPFQTVERHTATAVAPFPEVLHAQLLALPASLRGDPEVAAAHAALVAEGRLPEAVWDLVQGAVNRTVRRELNAEAARAYLREVDLLAGAYREPWAMGESRFIANANPGKTMQHRRAYLEPHTGGRPNGRLVKRWPAEERGPAEANSTEACRLAEMYPAEDD